MGPGAPPPPVASQQSGIFSAQEIGAQSLEARRSRARLPLPWPVSVGFRHKEKRRRDFPIDLCELSKGSRW